MEVPKKISFGFAKSSKQPNISIIKPQETHDVELIDCLEYQSIKIKNVIEEITSPPLVIPLKDNAKDLLERVQHSKQARRSKTKVDEAPEAELTLDALAARELIKEAQHKQVNNTSECKVYSLPTSRNELTLENSQESTLDDYENIPINDFGLAMLRGMGWKESTGIGKQNKQVVKPLDPELRPKGMGLGANKVINLKMKTGGVDNDGNELILVKGAYAKIIAGKNSGDYCEVLGLDEESGRIIVKTAIKKTVVSLHEFLAIPVTKEEYTKFGKIIRNNATFEEHKQDINSEFVRSSNMSSYRQNIRNIRNCSDANSSTQASSRKNSVISEQRNRPGRFDYKSGVHKQKHRNELPSKNYKNREHKFNYRKESESSETSDRGHRNAKRYDYYASKVHSSKYLDESNKYKKKKSGNYLKDSCSSDEYRKKIRKTKKDYIDTTSSSSSGSSNTSNDDRYDKPKNKYKITKNHR